jgi:Amt family ammonium transporter
VAFLNTDLAASFAAMAWMMIDWLVGGRPHFLGLLTGAVAGLATVTPAAGYVSPMAACLIGVASGVVCYYGVALKNILKWDDALDVWGVHGVGGYLGIVMLGVLASTAWNPAASGGVDGLLRGGTHFFLVEWGSVTLAAAWAFFFTLGMLWVIERITPVKVPELTEKIGLDEGIHGEKAYVFEGATLHP